MAKSRQRTLGWAVFHRLIAPESTVLIAWGVGLVMFAIAVANAQSMPYFTLLVHKEGLRDISTPFAFLWLTLAILAFVLGSRLGDRKPRPVAHGHAFERGNAIVVAFILTGGVAFAWIGMAVVQLGGVAQMAALAASENLIARERILNAAFPGGRLISSGLLGLAVLAAAQLGAVTRPDARGRPSVTLILVLAGSLAYLAIVPILTSGRINFFVAGLGAFVAASLAAARPLPLRYVLVGAAALAASWTAKQYFTLSHISDASATQQGFEGLLFYFYNDLLNALNPVENMGEHKTWGWYSVRFVFYLTFTNNSLRSIIADDISHMESWMSAGEVPFLTAPFVDFGVLGLLVLIAAGYFCRRMYRMSINGVEYAAIYGICFATLTMSVHNSYLTSQEVVYNMLLILVVGRSARSQERV
ncbi:hypothetical protein [Ramlibacter sp. Leaf400]|uniref:hypothetical protein n=1 Tax=Ramlibacter sp. Leaf400 TaxID=1736365 RepID=UPI0006F6BCEB|nr:hypothetical protein [Ramlibacter sp. Leaf400]KQT10826.1 hypothetical protein ASG30_08425 [Ramlibacter sp. Leaf400]